MSSPEPCVFALRESRDFGAGVCAALGIAPGRHEERDFEDGEHKTRPLESVRGRDVFVIQSLHGDRALSVNDKLCRLLFFLGALRDASAARLTAVLPYLCYARKDRQTKSRDPVTTRYVARLLESAGVDRVVALDVHNLAAFQNAYRCRTDHLEARGLLVQHLAPLLAGESVVVVSPDVGGIKRAEAFRQSLARRLGTGVASAFMEKQRSGGVVSGEAVVGEVSGRAAVIVDDLISTGGTIARTARACRRRGARQVHAVATHGVFAGDAARTLSEAPLDRLVVTNSIPPALALPRLTVLDAAPLIAQAIRRLHEGGSLVELLAEPGGA